MASNGSDNILQSRLDALEEKCNWLEDELNDLKRNNEYVLNRLEIAENLLKITKRCIHCFEENRTCVLCDASRFCKNHLYDCNKCYKSKLCRNCVTRIYESEGNSILQCKICCSEKN